MLLFLQGFLELCYILLEVSQGALELLDFALQLLVVIDLHLKLSLLCLHATALLLQVVLATDYFLSSTINLSTLFLKIIGSVSQVLVQLLNLALHRTDSILIPLLHSLYVVSLPHQLIASLFEHLNRISRVSLRPILLK